MSNVTDLSVVVPIRNEEQRIPGTLEALVRQDYPKDRYEILVVDGQSTDETRRVVEEFIRGRSDANVRLLDNPGRLSSRARNIGVRAAHGELIAVIDGHVHIPNNRLFVRMMELKRRHQALCLARPAPLFPPRLGKGTGFWIAVARESWLAHGRGSYIYSDFEGFVNPLSSGFAYDRQVFEQVGYFDEVFDAAEDVEFHYRLNQAGIEAYTSADLTIYSYPRDSLRGLFRQMTRYGIGRARLIQKHPKSFTKETLIPLGVFLFFAAFPLALLLGRWLPIAGGIYMVLLAIYGLMVGCTGLACALKRQQPLAGPLVGLAIWTTHMGLGWGLLGGFATRRRIRAAEVTRHDESDSTLPIEESVHS